jgi:hypothetical protein
MQFDRLAAFAITLTIMLMFSAIGLLGPWIGTLPLPQTVALGAATVLASLSAYKLIAGGLFAVFRRSVRLRRFVLGPSFLEGTWVGHYERNGQHRFTIEVFDQEDGTTRLQGREIDYGGATCASWHSDAVSIDLATRRLIYAYTCDVYGRSNQQQGLAVFNLICPKKGKPPTILDGYAVDLIDGDKNPNKERKISDGITTDDEALIEARRIFSVP